MKTLLQLIRDQILWRDIPERKQKYAYVLLLTGLTYAEADEICNSLNSFWELQPYTGNPEPAYVWMHDPDAPEQAAIFEQWPNVEA